MSRPLDLRERAWESYPGILALGGSGAPHRTTRTFGGITCADLGVPHPWSVQGATGSSRPSEDDLAAAVSWMSGRGATTGWRIAAREEHLGGAPWPELVAHDRMGLFATPAASAARIPVEAPDELRLVEQPTHAEVLAAYGGWMDDLPLAELLVTPADLHRPERQFIVGVVDGAPIGCACVWWSGGAAYLSAIGVVAPMRGRGYGRALTAAAARMAVSALPSQSPDVVWMHATDEGAALYAHMGFDRVDTEVALGPADGNP